MSKNRYIWSLILATLFMSSHKSVLAGSNENAPDTIPGSNWSIGVVHNLGAFLANQPKSAFIRDSYTSLTEIFAEKKTNGEADWHLSHNYPSVGLGFMVGNSGSKEYIGNLYALYPYIRFPVLKTRRYEGSIKTGGGVAIVAKPYNVYTNPKNTLIGTRFNIFLSFVFQNEIRLSEQLRLVAGLGIMHVSNGSTKLPNLGLNIPNINAGIRYQLGRQTLHKKILADTGSSKIDLAAYTSVSFKQYPWVGGSYYLINAAQFEATKRMRRNYSIGAGAIFFYDRTLRRYIMEDRPDNPTYKKFQAGLYLSYEHFLGRLSVPLNIGAYIYNGSSAGIFQQYGIRYKINQRISTQFLLKSHSGQADFIHTGIGYNF
ncbi:MAG: acyloxyacyl hydrolase, partial [Chitinophagaceae bacterium]